MRTNYRPISFISNLANIFEKIIHRRNYEFAIEHKIIYPNQHGFLKTKGKRDALSYVINLICKNFGKIEPVIATLLDLANAFGAVNYKIILNKF